MKKNIYKIIGILTIVLIGIQFLNINNQENQPVNRYDIIKANNAPKDVTALLENTCYDCHSNQTKTYWYSNIAPVAWLINKDVKDGRAHLNFSDWEKYSHAKKLDYAGEIMQEVYEGEMPLKEYVWMHKEAKLSKNQQHKITQWVNSLVE